MRYRYGEADVWGVPGGGVADGETLVDTLRRELREELGVDIEVAGLLCLAETMPAGNVKHTLHCVFTGRVSGGVPAINPVETTALAVEWMPLGEISGRALYPPINDYLVEPGRAKSTPAYAGVLSRPWL